MSAVPTIQSKLDLHTPKLSQTLESASGKSTTTAESKNPQPSQSSVGESGKEPARAAQVTQSLDQNVSPKTNNINDTKNKKKVDNVQPLVKPFPSQPTNTKPLEFPPKNISSPEPTSMKPPWANTKNKLSSNEIYSNKSLESLNKSKSAVKESAPPSINNLPKLVTQKSTEAAPLSPKLSPEVDMKKKESTQQQSINNLPKLKQDTVIDKIENPQEVGVSRNEQGFSPKSPTVKQPPLVVPFPGKQQQAAAQVQQSVLPQSAQQPIQVQQVSSTEQVPEVVPNQQIQQIATIQVLQQPPAQLTQPTAPIQLMKQDSPKSLINNMPKPFKAETEKSSDSINEKVVKASPQQLMQPEKQQSPAKQPEPKNIIVTVKSSYSKNKSTDSIGSAISLSSNEEPRESKSTPNSPMILAKPNGPNINMSTISPSNSSSNIQGTPEKRDSKVIKAAAYWNNFIGEVTSKAKPPSNPKLLEKPKKITSAGIGEKGLKELTSAFETGKPIEKEDKMTLIRRNSKKMNVETCNPGLRVNDAKSHFEKKFQQPPETPRMSRRASGSLEKPRWGVKDDKESDNSKSPSPTKSEKTMSLPQPLGKSKSISKSPVPERTVKEHLPPMEPKQENKLKTEVHRNAMAGDIAKPAVSSEPEKIAEVIKNGNESNYSPDACSSSNNLIISKDQPKPPTSPKPKVRKEELKIKEELAKSKDDKPHPQLITKRTDEPASMVAPLKVSEKEIGEQAVVKKLKEEPQKPKQQSFVTTLEISHKPTEFIDSKVENNDQQVTPQPLKPILKDKSKDLDKTSAIRMPESDSQSSDFVSPSTNKKAGKETTPDIEYDTKHVVKMVKIKSPEPDKSSKVSSPEPKVELADVRSSLKKVPHVAVARRRSFAEREDDVLELPSDKKSAVKEFKSEIVVPVNSASDQTSVTQSTPTIATQTHLKTQSQTFDNNVAQNKDTDTPKERIIPIQFINENRGPKPFKLESSSRPETPVNSLPQAFQIRILFPS